MTTAVGVVAIALVVVAGSYAVAVLDTLVWRAVARRPVGLPSVLVAPVRRGATLLVQGGTRTERPDLAAWVMAPALLVASAAASLTAVPLDDGVAVADVPDGIALYGAAMAMVLVAVYLHGWAANSPFPLLGAYRFVAQGLSYPIPFLLTLIAAALAAESLSVGAIVESQAGLWNVLGQPLGLPVYVVSGWGLAFWGPLNLADAPDIAGGAAAETSGPALLVWRMGQAAVLVSVAAMGAAAFLGGWHGPLLPGWAWMLLKTAVLLAVLVAGRHLVGRIAVERFVLVAWVVLIPLALADVFVSGALAL